ncbi:MAG: hypothetical protein J5802_01990 [Butyrivibrio sp.]|nr:hypothetical protein [Butyrivibrio sp.]
MAVILRGILTQGKSFFAQMSAGEDGGKSILMQVINPLALITIRFAPIVAAFFHYMGRRDGSIAATTAISWIGSGRMMIRAGQ